MKSERPKVLHEVGGRPLFLHAFDSASAIDVDRKIIVVGHGAEAVTAKAIDEDASIVTVTQAERLGTGHAVAQAHQTLADAGGDTLVLYGDTPFIRPETLAEMARLRADGADIVVLGFEAADPGKYGRLVTDGDVLLRIVEYCDATDEERAIRLCNSGVVLAETATLLSLVGALGNDNASGEYYLTDIVVLGAERGLATRVVTCTEAETLGVNSRADLAAAETVFQNGARLRAMENGVTLEAPDTVHFSFDTEIGRDVVVEPNVIFGPGVTVETGARIRAFSHLEGAHVGAGATVGPYARLRPGAELGNDARVGNFIEIKNAVIGEGAKVPHLSYVGDASIGNGTNIGAGTITCNYDGVSKHRTEIGAGVFIGSNTMLIAPVSVGDAAVTATATVVTDDVPAGDLAIGRARQTNKPGYGRRLMDALRAAAGKGR